MKNSLLLFLVLFSLTAKSQVKNIKGLWKTSNSNYTTLISYKLGKFKFTTKGGESKIKQIVVNKGDDFVTTRIDNLSNGNKRIYKYVLLSNGNLQVTSIGDFKGILIFEKQNE
tara:strand:+ start:859 stop:1197 length:339 start_codon:yes stop_codon:yes gene_type:complete